LYGSLTCRKAATWDRRLYFPSEGRHAEDIFRPGLNPLSWVPGSSMLTTRPLKPLIRVALLVVLGSGSCRTCRFRTLLQVTVHRYRVRQKHDLWAERTPRFGRGIASGGERVQWWGARSLTAVYVPFSLYTIAWSGEHPTFRAFAHTPAFFRNLIRLRSWCFSHVPALPLPVASTDHVYSYVSLILNAAQVRRANSNAVR
jgi:hypothetical protein